MTVVDGRHRLPRRLPQAQAEAAKGRRTRGSSSATSSSARSRRARARHRTSGSTRCPDAARRVDDAAVLQVHADRAATLARRGCTSLFVTFILTGVSNAVNLTDGLDGLAAGLTRDRVRDVRDLRVRHRPRRHERVPQHLLPARRRRAHDLLRGDGRRAASASSGTTRIPAQVFMGDTGSLALGGALGAVAILLKSEFLLLFVGGGVRRRDGVGDPAALRVQVPEAALRARVRAEAPRLPARAAAPPLRAEGMDRDAGGRALLDPRHPRARSSPSARSSSAEHAGRSLDRGAAAA